ncbi:MAG: hypothetical protein WAW61_11950 [Methylococcaceae bacterium]
MSSEPSFWTVTFSKPSFWIFIGGILIVLGIGAKMLIKDSNEYGFAYGLLVVIALISLVVSFSLIFG